MYETVSFEDGPEIANLKLIRSRINVKQIRELERVCDQLEDHSKARWGAMAMTEPEARRRHPEIGADVKVMGVRYGKRIRLTVGCAFVGRHVSSLDDYLAKKRRLTAPSTRSE